MHAVVTCPSYFWPNVFPFLLPAVMSQLGAYFDIEGRNTYLTAELRAGCVAFLTVSK